MPQNITFSDFKNGLDLRRSISTSDASALRVLKNAYVTPGKTVKKRPGLTLVAALEAGTVGLSSGGDKLNTYYGGAGTITHANALFRSNSLRHPTALAVTSIHYSDVFNGFQYVAAEHSDASIRHYYLDEPGAWVAATVYPLGTFRRPVTKNNLRYEVTAIAGTGTSGATEPVWPTALGATVIDNPGANQITWTCRSFSIVDANCPNTKQVIKIASKIWAVGTNGDTVRYCATNAPRDWTTANNAGFLPVGLQQAGANRASALGYYTNRLVVFFADSAQVWAVDPDPALIARLSDNSVDVGTVHPAAHANMAGDVFFLSPSGVKTITRQDVTTNLIDSDVGASIDEALLDGTLISLVRPRAQYHRGGGQYWLYSGSKAMVFTFSRSTGISAWSLYEYPFNIDYMTELNAELYMRSGNNVYKVDRAARTDAGVLYSVDIELPYVDFKAPGVLKQIHAMDAVITGSCQISHRYDVRSPTLVTDPPVTITGDSRPGNVFPVELMAVNLAPVLRNYDDQNFELHGLSYLYSGLGLM